jgi:hypothetical protein
MDKYQQIKIDAAKIFCRSSVPYLLAAFDESLKPHERLFAFSEAYNHTFNALFAADKALQSLTPGGSEYVADYDRCANYAKDRMREQQEKIITLLKERKNNDDLHASGKNVDVPKQQE